MLRRRLAPALLLVVLGAALTSCGGGDGDGDGGPGTRTDTPAESGVVAAGLEAEVEATYDREGDPEGGVLAPSCFLLDESAVEELGVALGQSLEVEPGYVTGPAESATVQCALRPGGAGDVLQVLVQATDQTAAELISERREADDPSEVLDVSEVEELDVDDVAAFSTTTPGGGPDDVFVNAFSFQGGVKIGVGGPGSLVEAEDVLGVLPVLVDKVGRVLGDG